VIQNKVVHLITTIAMGGAEKQLLVLVREQILQGLEVEIFYLKRIPELKEEFERIGAKVNSSLANQSFFSQVLKFRRIQRSNNFFIHTHLPQAELVAALCCKKKSFVISRHNFEPFWPNKPRFISTILSKYVSSRAVHVVAISYAIKDYLLSSNEVPKNLKITVVYYGFNNQITKPRNMNQINDMELNSTSDFKIGTIGRLVPGKNYQTLLSALAQVCQVNPRVKLFIVGDGVSKNELLELVQNLDLAGNIIWLGRTAYIDEFLQKIDLFVFPSLGEGFGLVLLEAMLASKPIIAANNSAIPEVLGASYSGLFPTTDSKILSQKILEVSEDSLESQNLVDEYSKQIQLFSAKNMADKILKIYTECGF
jgi:glycosyltransferase involved in cell wall biosynthesis